MKKLTDIQPMLPEELLHWARDNLFDVRGNVSTGKIKKFKKHQNYLELLKIASTVPEAIWLLQNGGVAPRCKCGNKTQFQSLKKGYLKFCSTRCMANDEDVKSKIKKTVKDKYGTDNVAQSELVKAKIAQTNLQRYNVTSPLALEKTKQKIKNTNLERYGVECVLTMQGVREKGKKRDEIPVRG